MSAPFKKTKADEMKFQVDLAKHQLGISSLYTVSGTLWGAAFGVLIGMATVMYNTNSDVETAVQQFIKLFEVLAGVLFILLLGGGVTSLIANFYGDHKLKRFYREAKEFGDVSQRDDGSSSVIS
ncbi:MAG: hypothetical protein ACREAW_01580 [Nitrososphaera sp.]